MLVHDAYRAYQDDKFIPFGIHRPENLFSAEELDGFSEVKRVFYSPYSTEVFFLPIEAFDFGLERDRILFAIMLRELRLKAQGSQELALAERAFINVPSLASYVNVLG